jgi:hypothetical protein
MQSAEDEGLTTKEFYRQIQRWIAPQMLVDKSARRPGSASRRPRRSSTRPRSRSRRASSATRPTSCAPSSRRPAPPSRSSSPFGRAPVGAPLALRERRLSRSCSSDGRTLGRAGLSTCGKLGRACCSGISEASSVGTEWSATPRTNHHPSTPATGRCARSPSAMLRRRWRARPGRHAKSSRPRQRSISAGRHGIPRPPRRSLRCLHSRRERNRSHTRQASKLASRGRSGRRGTRPDPGQIDPSDRRCQSSASRAR